MRKDIFAGYHPAVNFFFLCGAIFMGLVVQHPLWIVISFTSSICYAIYLGGRKALKFLLIFVTPMVVLTAVLNPVFVHQGVTILFYLGNNPVTREAVVYGITRGLMFGTGLLWFYCYQYLMTGDKFMHLFGKIIPAGSLIFSMVLGFIPRFTARMRQISDAQKCVGNDVTDGGIGDRMKHGMKVLSIMTTWSLENAIDTSDSMKSRGYGLHNRSAYVPYGLTKRDGALGMLVLVLLGMSVVATFTGMNLFVCYPAISMAETGLKEGWFALAYAIYCFIPIWLNLLEGMKWKHIQSEI